MPGTDPRSLLETVRTTEADLAAVLARIEDAGLQGLDLSSLSQAVHSLYETQARLIRDVDTFLDRFDSGNGSHMDAAQALAGTASGLIQGLAAIVAALEPIREVAGLVLRLTCAVHNWHTLAEDLQVLLCDPGARKIETILLNLPVSPGRPGEPGDGIFPDIVQ